jgi:hypothetical protein
VKEGAEVNMLTDSGTSLMPSPCRVEEKEERSVYFANENDSK